MQPISIIGLVAFVRLTFLITAAHIPYAFIDSGNVTSVRWTTVVLCALVALFFVAGVFVRRTGISKHVLMALLTVPIIGGIFAAASQGALTPLLFVILLIAGFYWLVLFDVIRANAYEIDTLWLFPAQTVLSFSIAGFETFPLLIILMGTVIVAVAESNVLHLGAFFPATYATALSAATWVVPLFVIAILPTPISTLLVFALFACMVSLATLFRRARQNKAFGLEYARGWRMLVFGVPALIVSVFLIALIADEYRIGYYAAFALTCAGALLVDGWVRGKLEGATAGVPSVE